MPLSPPASRQLLHTREICCRGYQRDDGLWDIEAHLVDTKTYEFTSNHRGVVAPGVPVHGMWIRITIDETLSIHDIESVTDHAPYGVCPATAPAFDKLKGLRIATGWTREVQKRLGGVNGCTHLVELLRPLATTAFQTLVKHWHQQSAKNPATAKKPWFINSCHALASDGEIIKQQFPEHYTGK